MNNINVPQQNFEKIEDIKNPSMKEVNGEKAKEILDKFPKEYVDLVKNEIPKIWDNSEDKEDPTATNEQNLANAKQEENLGKAQYWTNLDRPEDNLA